jgi:PhnB protein
MAITQLNPYLNFDGTAKKAIQLYEKALGAKVEHMQTFGDMPGNKPAPENVDRVLHAVLHVGAAVVMISDAPSGMQLAVGRNVNVCLDFDDASEMASKFAALSEGGTVTMPLQDTFWGAKFGMLTDAYGIPWMFNCNVRKA